MLRKMFFFLFLFFLYAGAAFAEDETLTITTYYPSPYGSYNEMRVNKIVIGDFNSTSAPSPANGAITFHPTGQPLASQSSEGTVYYDSGMHNFRFRDNEGKWNILGSTHVVSGLYGFCTQKWSKAAGGGTICTSQEPASCTELLNDTCSCPVGYDRKEVFSTVETSCDEYGTCPKISSEERYVCLYQYSVYGPVNPGPVIPNPLVPD